MTKEGFVLAMSALPDEIYEKFISIDAQMHRQRQRKKRVNIVTGACACCACVLLIIAVLPILNAVFGGAKSAGPETAVFNSMAEVDAYLDRSTVYSTLDLSSAQSIGITLLYKESENTVSSSASGWRPIWDVGNDKADNEQEKGDDNGEPQQLRINATYANGDGYDTVRYYLLFGINDPDRSYIVGYEEQGLSMTVNGIEIFYCHLDDVSHSSQAKFVYEGDLYVVNVNSGGDTHNLEPHLNRVLEGLKGRENTQ